MNSSSSFEISQDSVSSSGGTQTCFSLLFMVLTGLNILRTKYDSVKKRKRKSDRFLVWRESSQWCRPAPLWFLESGLPRSGGSSPSFAWLVWPARCPSGGPCKKQNGGRERDKVAVTRHQKKKKNHPSHRHHLDTSCIMETACTTGLTLNAKFHTCCGSWRSSGIKFVVCT